MKIKCYVKGGIEFQGHHAPPQYKCIILYKTQIMKVATRNNLLTKNLQLLRRGANPSTIRMTVLALSYSMAEYAATVVWAISPRV